MSQFITVFWIDNMYIQVISSILHTVCSILHVHKYYHQCSGFFLAHLSWQKIHSNGMISAQILESIQFKHTLFSLMEGIFMIRKADSALSLVKSALVLWFYCLHFFTNQPYNCVNLQVLSFANNYMFLHTAKAMLFFVNILMLNRKYPV